MHDCAKGYNSGAMTQMLPFAEAIKSPCCGLPPRCNVPGIEATDSLAEEGSTSEQVNRSASYPEVKTIRKVKQHSKWRSVCMWGGGRGVGVHNACLSTNIIYKQ